MLSRIVRHGIVDSTNERAFAAIAAGEARDEDVHVAEEQTAGRGRRGARWVSPGGEGLYASWIVISEGPAPPPASFTVLAGLAVLDAIEVCGVVGARLKWPNDVLLGEAKLSGILVEARGYDPERPCFVIGIGINVAQQSFPAELREERPVTSLRLAGSFASRDDVLNALMEALPVRLEQARRDLVALTNEYLGRAHLTPGDVSVRTPGGEFAGKLIKFCLTTGSVVLQSKTGTHTARLEHLLECRPLTTPAAVRPATPTDDRVIALLSDAAWRVAYRKLVPAELIDHYSIETRISRRVRRRTISPDHRTFVVEREGRVLGFVSCGPAREKGDFDERDGEIYSIYVHPETWRAGLGQLLFGRAKLDLVQRGFISLRLWVLTENAPSRRFYERMGMSVDIERQSFIFGGHSLDHALYSVALNG